MQQKIKIDDKELTGHLVELGPVNLVFAVGKTGLAGCGAFDVDVLDKFDYPAVKIAGPANAGIKNIQDLINGTVKHANKKALKIGIKPHDKADSALKRLA